MRWVTAANHQQWADTLQARTNLPELVADLIRTTTTNILDIRLPGGDKGQVGGFDHLAQYRGRNGSRGTLRGGHAHLNPPQPSRQNLQTGKPLN